MISAYKGLESLYQNSFNAYTPIFGGVFVLAAVDVFLMGCNHPQKPQKKPALNSVELLQSRLKA
ncbi:hypothetical protein IJ00_26780 (plasmid) [Calothrix sp. 336/3]|nr:hypothetical protein IJ00_26780 [Calothrix sp. 336/3]